jgi:hypothetical protein
MFLGIFSGLGAFWDPILRAIFNPFSGADFLKVDLRQICVAQVVVVGLIVVGDVDGSLVRGRPELVWSVEGLS